jgi:ATP-dependent helicase/nuclease subunit B
MGLPGPERSVGLSAHDFTLGFCAPRVIITRAARAGSAPTIPSRWLQRLETVLLAAGLSLHSGAWLERLRARERPARVTPALRPAPAPPVETRPKALSVTGVEQWVRDPYGVYARHVLKLKQLEIIDKSIDAADRGTILHSVLEDFIRAHPDPLPEDAYDRLLALGTARLEAEIGDVRTRHFWGVRLRKMAEWFVSNEREWRTLAVPDGQEVRGEMTLPGTDFTLTAKADRIDRMRDGSGHAIIDYKTGAVPKAADIILGLSPQLPLEAGMLESGAFVGIGPSRPVALSHWLVNGGGEGGKAVYVKDTDPADLGRAALEGLGEMVRRFNDPATPYFSLPRPAVAPRYNDYAHLARVQEWAVIDDAEGEE